MWTFRSAELPGKRGMRVAVDLDRFRLHQLPPDLAGLMLALQPQLGLLIRHLVHLADAKEMSDKALLFAFPGGEGHFDLVELLAAISSVIYGLWGIFVVILIMKVVGDWFS